MELEELTEEQFTDALGEEGGASAEDQPQVESEAPAVDSSPAAQDESDQQQEASSSEGRWSKDYESVQDPRAAYLGLRKRVEKIGAAKATMGFELEQAQGRIAVLEAEVRESRLADALIEQDEHDLASIPDLMEDPGGHIQAQINRATAPIQERLDARDHEATLAQQAHYQRQESGRIHHHVVQQRESFAKENPGFEDAARLYMERRIEDWRASYPSASDQELVGAVGNELNQHAQRCMGSGDNFPQWVWDTAIKYGYQPQQSNGHPGSPSLQRERALRENLPADVRGDLPASSSPEERQLLDSLVASGDPWENNDKLLEILEGE